MISVSLSGQSIRHTKRKARELNPHLHVREHRFSKPARPTRIRLPSVFTQQWTDRELNPDLQTASLASSHWTISPSSSVDRRGIEPRLPGCKPSVFPLDQRPVSIERSVPELNRVFLLTEEVCCRNTYRPFSQQ